MKKKLIIKAGDGWVTRILNRLNTHKITKKLQEKRRLNRAPNPFGYSDEYEDFGKSVRKQIINRAFNWATGQDKLPLDTIRYRLYRNLYPFSYSHPLTRTHNAVIKNKSEYDDMDENLVNGGRDDIWATYLNIPKNKRRKFKRKVLVVPSKYYPGKYTLNDEDMWPDIYEAIQGYENYVDENDELIEGSPVDYGKQRTSLQLNRYFGRHLIGNNRDSKGAYMWYRDLWDIAPISDKRDESRGIGTPIEFQDKMYYNDYYDVPKRNRNTALFLPEVEVYSR